LEKRICVIGAGRWGQNHIKTLSVMGNLAGIVETDQKRLEMLDNEYGVRCFTEVKEAVLHGFDGYIVATPAESHYPIGKLLLEQGLNVLIEKPMALSSKHSEELVKIADLTGAGLMVGHLLLFHPAIRKIKELLECGKIGSLYYIYSNRLNLGTVRTEENVFWSFAPHDVSVFGYLIGAEPTAIESKGAKFLQDEIYDVTVTQLTYPGNIHAHIFVSWLHPFKEQRLVLVGSRGKLSFDDYSEEKNILYYNKRIAWNNGKPIKEEQPDEIVDYQKSLPLDEELKYFVRHLGKKIEFADGRTGHEVVKVLEKVQALIS